MVWSGLNSKFSAVYKIDGKSEAVTHESLLQFISDNGVPEGIITDGEKSENLSTSWKRTCAKHFINQHCSEAYKQNQNYVERFVQMAKDGVSKFKQMCGLKGNEYLFDMWTHYSDVDNHLARKV